MAADAMNGVVYYSLVLGELKVGINELRICEAGKLQPMISKLTSI